MELDKYIEIKALSNPQRAFEILEDEFIDIMYVDSLTQNSLIMLLDVGLDGNKHDDIEWLKDLLDTILPKIGETEYFLVPYMK